MDETKPGITPEMLSESDKQWLRLLLMHARRGAEGCTFVVGEFDEFDWADRLLNPEETDGAD